MKVVILAAGKGSRLGEANTPKPLTRLANDKSILKNQLDVLHHFVSWDDIIIVVGYHKEQIMEQFSDLMFVYNSHYASQNTAKSLLLALNKIDDDVLWLNGDVVMHFSVIESVLRDRKTSMVVNEGKVDAEEVKYRLDDEQRITEVSKNVEYPVGEALGINFWERKDLDSFRKQLHHCSDQDYFERGIELYIEQGMAVWSVRVDQSLCTEIDFPEDLARANQMISKW